MLPTLNRPSSTQLRTSSVSGTFTARPTVARTPATVRRHPKKPKLTCTAAKQGLQVTVQTPSGQQKPMQKVCIHTHAADCWLLSLWRMKLARARSLADDALKADSDIRDQEVCVQDFFSIGTAGGSDLLLEGQQGHNCQTASKAGKCVQCSQNPIVSGVLIRRTHMISCSQKL